MRNYANKFLKYPVGSNLAWRYNKNLFKSSTILSNEFFSAGTSGNLSAIFAFSYALAAATQLTIALPFRYELETASALTKPVTFTYALLSSIAISLAQTPVLAVTASNAASSVAQAPVLAVTASNAASSVAQTPVLVVATRNYIQLSKTIEYSYELLEAASVTKTVNFSYELQTASQLSTTLAFSYELTVSSALTTAINFSCALLEALPVSRLAAFSYELQTASQLTNPVLLSYELLTANPLSSPIAFSYVLEIALPLSKTIVYSYELLQATLLSKALTLSYELTNSLPTTKTLTFAYEISDAALTKAINFGYELTPNAALSRGVVFSYVLSLQTLTKTLISNYEIFQNTLGSLIAQTPVLTISKINGKSQIAQTPVLIVSVLKRPSQIAQTPFVLVNKNRVDFSLKYLHPQSPVNEIWQFKTTVNKSTQGQEQRMSVRASPRLAVKFDYLLDDVGDLATLKYLHDAMERGRVLFPLHQYGARILSGAGSNTLTLANRGLAYAAGQAVGMQGRDGAWHVTTLTAGVGNTVTLAVIAPNPANWQHASLYPMALARATGGLSLQLGRGQNSAELEILLDVNQPLQFANYLFGLVNNLPLLDLPFIINGAQSLETSLETNWRDIGGNAASPFVLMSQPETSFSLKFNTKVNELQKLGAVLSATRGKLNSFYVALNQNLFEGCAVLNGDLIASNAMLHNLSLLADNTFLLINKTLTVKIVDRFYNYNLQGEIVSTTLKTSPQIPANFNASFVQQLVKARLDSDDFNVVHTDNYLQLELKARTLPNEF